METRGRNGYDKTHLLRTVLFAYMINVHSLRDIEKICPNGCVFDEYVGTKHDRKYSENIKIINLYRNHNQCEACPLRKECLKKEEGIKTIGINPVQEEMYRTVDAILSSEFGQYLKKQRCVQVEGAFGVIKNDMKFTRFTRRGMGNTKMEFLLICTAYNLRKYHHYRQLQKKAEPLN